MSYLRTGTVLFHYGLAIPCFGHVLHADLFSKGDRIASTPPAECLPKLLKLAAAPRHDIKGWRLCPCTAPLRLIA